MLSRHDTAWPDRVMFDSFYVRVSTMTAIYRRSITDSGAHRRTNTTHSAQSSLMVKKLKKVNFEIYIADHPSKY